MTKPNVPIANAPVWLAAMPVVVDVALQAVGLFQEREVTRRLRQEHRQVLREARLRLKAYEAELAYNARFVEQQVADAESARRACLAVIEGLQDQLRALMGAYVELLKVGDPALDDRIAHLDAVIQNLIERIAELARDLRPTTIAELRR